MNTNGLSVLLQLQNTGNILYCLLDFSLLTVFSFFLQHFFVRFTIYLWDALCLSFSKWDGDQPTDNRQKRKRTDEGKSTTKAKYLQPAEPWIGSAPWHAILKTPHRPHPTSTHQGCTTPQRWRPRPTSLRRMGMFFWPTFHRCLSHSPSRLPPHLFLFSSALITLRDTAPPLFWFSLQLLCLSILPLQYTGLYHYPCLNEMIDHSACTKSQHTGQAVTLSALSF